MYGWGSLLCLGSNAQGPTLIESLSELGGIQQIVCADACLLALTKAGRVFRLGFTADSQVSLYRLPQYNAKYDKQLSLFLMNDL